MGDPLQPGYGSVPPQNFQTQYPPLNPPATESEKSKKMLAGLLGIFLGAWGVHKFILGYNQEGVIHICVMLALIVITVVTCGIGAILGVVPWVIGIIEGVIYLSKSDDDFVRIYIRGRRPWF